jgi:hypothetical protein
MPVAGLELLGTVMGIGAFGLDDDGLEGVRPLVA